MTLIPLVLPHSQLQSPGTLGPVCPFSLSAPGPQSLSQTSKVSLTQARARRAACYRRKGASSHWNRTLAGPFPLQSLSFFIRDMGAQLLSRGLQGLQYRKGFWGAPAAPASADIPAPLPVKPATQCPYPRLNPEGTVAEPAAPLPGFRRSPCLDSEDG